MKRTFLTILPIAAALLLATSCSKDSDNDNNVVSNPTPVETQNIASPTESNAVPFSIKVVTSSDGLSKIGYVDADGKVTPSFTAEDVTGNLAMTISEGEKELGTLSLQDADGNFSGNLTTEPSAEGATLTATITTTGEATSSTVSITDLMANCAHTYTGTFKYKTDTKVMLTDDKAYIEIIMSPLQHNIDVTIGSDKQNYAMSNDGKVWIAVDGGTKFTTNFTNEKTTTAGKITTIDRSGFVDLGIEGGILWADTNVTGGEGTYKEGYGWYYTFDQAQKLDVTFPTGGDDDNTDFKKLYNECNWVLSSNGYNVFKKKSGDSPSYSADTDPHIFLPAAGYCDASGLHNAGSLGGYWSLSSDNPNGAYVLYFFNGKVDPGLRLRP